MFGSVATALVLAASVSRVVASPIDHVARNYAKDAPILEDYTTYHVRYIALDCQDKHNTAFFDECCHPLLRWQKLSDRPKQCIPSASASSSAAVVEPTAKPIDEDPLPDDEDCDPESTSVAPTYSAPPATPTPKSSYSEPAPKPASTPAPEPTTTKPTTTHEPTTTKEPTTTQEPTTTHKTTSAKPTTSAAPDNNNNDDYFTGGFGTFFEQNGQAGACGDKHGDDDLLVALDYRRYGPLDQKSKFCGQKVQIINVDNGKEVTAIVADACPTCKNDNCLDLSHGAYDKIGERVTGMLNIKWKFLD